MQANYAQMNSNTFWVILKIVTKYLLKNKLIGRENKRKQELEKNTHRSQKIDELSLGISWQLFETHHKAQRCTVCVTHSQTQRAMLCVTHSVNRTVWRIPEQECCGGRLELCGLAPLPPAFLFYTGLIK